MIKYISKLIMVVFVPVFSCRAACEATTKTYTACKSGYYLNNNSCKQCPVYYNSKRGTSADKNTNGISDCYIPGGASASDSSGTYKYTNDCYYK